MNMIWHNHVGQTSRFEFTGIESNIVVRCLSIGSLCKDRLTVMGDTRQQIDYPWFVDMSQMSHYLFLHLRRARERPAYQILFVW